ERLGTLERDGELSLLLPGGARRAQLTVVVESLGRINYGPRIGEGKGIMRGVRINGRRYLHGWSHRALPIDAAPRAEAPTAGAHSEHLVDGVARATIEVDDPADAWLAFPGGTKGMVWLNGFLLGRYWSVGP